MKTFATTYLATAFVMLGLDSLWLTLTSGQLYHTQLGAILLPEFAVLPASVFYLIYVLGLVVLVGLPALTAGNWRYAATRGGMLGCCAYATYDLTNQATLKGWSTVVTLADMAWGTALSAAAATGAYVIVRAVSARAKRR